MLDPMLISSMPPSPIRTNDPFDGRQLRDVFNLCDPEGTGFVSVQRLVQLARSYCVSAVNPQEVQRLVQQLDPEGRGELEFREFCQGVCAILRASGQEADSSGIESPKSHPKACSTPKSKPMMATLPPPQQQPEFRLSETPLDTSTTNGHFKPGNISSPVVSSPGIPPRLYVDSPDHGKSSQCSSMSDEELFECYGEGVDGEVAPGHSPPRTNGSPASTNGLHRQSWSRTSLRRTAQGHHLDTLPNRRWGSLRQSRKNLSSNAQASQLYRSSSFHSSGRSSINDPAEDLGVTSDVSLEEDVMELSSKVGALQQQMAVLTEQQSGTSERYARARHEAGVLQARVHMLEEQLREAEIRAEERLTQEQARHKEVVLRLERERQLQHENNSIKLQNVESEVKTLRTETQNLRSQLEELRHEKRLTLEELTTSEAQCETLRQQVEEWKTAHSRSETIINDERAINSQLMNEIKSFREREENSKTDRGESQDEMGDLQTMSSYVNILRHENAKLRETNEELEAQLLNNTSIQNTEVSGNIAEELQDIKNENLSKAMQEQNDVNLQLKNYIEYLLKMIMERNPQMLEIK